MLSFIRKLLLPPTFSDDEQTRQARIVHVLHLAVLLASLVIILGATDRVRILLTLVAGNLLGVFAYWLNRRGNSLTAGIILLGIMLFVITTLLLFGHGIHDIAIAALPVLLIMSALFLNSLGVYIFTGLAIGVTGFVVYAEINNLPWIDISPATSTDYNDFFMVASILSIAAVASQVLISQLVTSLNRLHISEARLRSLIENTTDFILEIDHNGKILFINKFPETYLGKNIRDVLPADQHEFAQQSIEKVFQSGEPQTIELKTISPNGNTTWDSIRLGPIKNNDTVTSLTIIVTEITQQKNAEEALRAQEELYRLISTITSDYVFTTDVEEDGLMRLTWVGGGFDNITGYTFDEFVARGGWRATIHPDDLTIDDHNLSTLRKNQKVVSELRVIHRNGEVRWMRVYAHPLWDLERNCLKGIYGAVQDITERKLAEEKLRISEQKFSKTFYASPDSVTLSEMESGRLVEVNDGFQKVFGYSREEAIGRTTLDLGLYNDPADRQQLIQTLREQGFVRNLELTGRHKSGRELTAWLSVELIEIDGRNHLITISRDITDRKRAEQEFRLSEEQYRTLIELSPDGIGVTDQNGTLTLVNKQAVKLHGYGSAEEMIGMNSLELVAPEDREYVIQQANEATSGSPGHFEYTLVRKEGSTFPAEASATFVFGPNGIPQRAITIFRDITERKQQEQEREKLIEELEAKNAELERFTYTISHDLKSPLVTIKGFLGYLKRDIAAGNTKRIDDNIERIGNASKKMELLLKDLLELSRIGRMVNPLEKVSFGDLVREALEIVHGQLEARGITVQTHPDLPVVYGDHLRLTEVLQNLLDNAAKYMGDQTHPRIEIGQRGEENGKSILFVKDNGMGIAPEYRERIFGLFNKLDAQSEGTGVGLALVKRIVEFHGGRIWVESEPGIGSTFYFTLPREQD
ncbi:MAG: PAS domain S-box protein [Anaerolineales bacterium]|nr:PAS domain S-box protein [Anaerolineales bacterium]